MYLEHLQLEITALLRWLMALGPQPGAAQNALIALELIGTMCCCSREWQVLNKTWGINRGQSHVRAKIITVACATPVKSI